MNSDGYDVYFGTGNPPPFVTNQAGTTYNTDTLEGGTTYFWRIDSKNVNGTTSGPLWSFTTKTEITSIHGPIGNTSYPLKAYPNPFYAKTTISYHLKSRGKAELSIYNMAGEKMETLVNQWQAEGEHSVNFDAGGLESGIYLIRLKAGDVLQKSKIILLE
jgi:hypothetical protein